MCVRTIELDCAPGAIRPGDLIAEVVRGTMLADTPAAKPEATVSRCFGNWTWSFPDISDEDWKKVQEITKPRIEALYHNGVIRYGSW